MTIIKSLDLDVPDTTCYHNDVPNKIEFLVLHGHKTAKNICGYCGEEL